MHRHFGPDSRLRIHAGPWVIDGLTDAYASVGEGAPLAIIGSRELLEIAVNAGSAAECSGLGVGDPVIVRREPSG